MTITGGRVVTISTGEAIRLGVEERDGSGHLLTGGSQTYTWTSSQPSVAEVSADGVLHSSGGLGGSKITARAASGLSDSIDVWVQPPASTPSTFHITLVFSEGVPDSWRIALEAAAVRWETVIRAELPAVAVVPAPRVCSPIEGEPPPTIVGVERGVRIYVEMSSHFGSDNDTEAVGGPCLQRPVPFPTTVYGRVSINRNVNPERAGTLRGQYVALHEMGHALGLVALIQGATVPWYDAATRSYTGIMAREGYRRITGGFPPAIAPVSAHWPFPADVMGSQAFILAITPLSIGALMDLGYPAAWYGGQ